MWFGFGFMAFLSRKRHNIINQSAVDASLTNPLPTVKMILVYTNSKFFYPRRECGAKRLELTEAPGAQYFRIFHPKLSSLVLLEPRAVHTKIALFQH